MDGRPQCIKYTGSKKNNEAIDQCNDFEGWRAAVLPLPKNAYENDVYLEYFRLKSSCTDNTCRYSSG